MHSEASLTDELSVTSLDQRSINTIRFLAVDGVQKANSGHPGMPMGCAPMAYLVWQKHLKHNPADPSWPDRDRFVLSAGHGSMLLYALLHLTGYDLPMDELKQFRQWGSKTPGHPENMHTAGVETTTGPLGQGFANGVGMAIAERFLAAHFNRPGFEVVDHYTYAIVSDGDLMEGVSHEAASLAGHLGLSKLIYLYDDNKISIDGRTDLSFSEDVLKRFEGYNWHVQTVADGNDVAALDAAVQSAKQETDRPSLIAVRTLIGFGSPNKQDTSSAHGSPLGPDEVTLTKRNLGWPEDQYFYVPDEVGTHMNGAEKGHRQQAAWEDLMTRYAAAYPDEAARLKKWLAGDLPEGWDDAVPTFGPDDKLATRAASGKMLDAILGSLGNLVGGSADLTPSNNTRVGTHVDFQKDQPGGGYLRFGVREHGMASICNGMILHGGVRPYCATFLVFSDYMRPAVRLSALMGQPVVYVFTHDSIGLGEDGPTHQPVEHFMALRAIPNLTLIRPADANETVAAWQVALEHRDGPTALALTRQKLPTLTPVGVAGVQQGAYILSDDAGTPEVILIASGSEVQLIVNAAKTLRADGIRVRVVSMPSWERFDAQPAFYRDSILPPEVVNRVAVEAGVSLGWERYVGLQGRIIGMTDFGASAPAGVLFEKFGFTAEKVVAQARALL